MNVSIYKSEGIVPQGARALSPSCSVIVHFDFSARSLISNKGNKIIRPKLREQPAVCVWIYGTTLSHSLSLAAGNYIILIKHAPGVCLPLGAPFLILKSFIIGKVAGSIYFWCQENVSAPKSATEAALHALHSIYRRGNLHSVSQTSSLSR
jgi:hypothetical protein